MDQPAVLGEFVGVAAGEPARLVGAEEDAVTKEAEEFVNSWAMSIFECADFRKDASKEFEEEFKRVLAAERERCAQAVNKVNTPYFIVDACVAAIRSLP